MPASSACPQTPCGWFRAARRAANLAGGQPGGARHGITLRASALPMVARGEGQTHTTHTVGSRLADVGACRLAALPMAPADQAAFLPTSARALLLSAAQAFVLTTSAAQAMPITSAARAFVPMAPAAQALSMTSAAQAFVLMVARL